MQMGSAGCSFNLLRWKLESLIGLPIAAQRPFNGGLLIRQGSVKTEKKNDLALGESVWDKVSKHVREGFCPQPVVQTPDGLHLRVGSEASFAGGAFEKTLKKLACKSGWALTGGCMGWLSFLSLGPWAKKRVISLGYKNKSVWEWDSPRTKHQSEAVWQESFKTSDTVTFFFLPRRRDFLRLLAPSASLQQPMLLTLLVPLSAPGSGWVFRSDWPRNATPTHHPWRSEDGIQLCQTNSDWASQLHSKYQSGK